VKRIFGLLIAAMVILSSVALAEDLSSLSDENLLKLYQRVTEEMERRHTSSRQEDPLPGSPQDAREPSFAALLYYVPEDGRYYHLDRNCKTVHEKYLPLQTCFTYEELEDEAYKYLHPCSVCAAPLSGDAFIVPNVIPAEGIEDFLGEWHYFRIVNEDGSEKSREEMLAEGILDDHAEIIITEDEIKLYTASLGDAGSVKYEYIPADGSLKILNGDDNPPVLHLADNGMLLFFTPAYAFPSGNSTVYLSRREP
jgi:hypothetical protein